MNLQFLGYLFIAGGLHEVWKLIQGIRTGKAVWYRVWSRQTSVRTDDPADFKMALGIHAVSAFAFFAVAWMIFAAPRD